LNKFIKCKFRG